MCVIWIKSKILLATSKDGYPFKHIENILSRLLLSECVMFILWLFESSVTITFFVFISPCNAQFAKCTKYCFIWSLLKLSKAWSWGSKRFTAFMLGSLLRKELRFEFEIWCIMIIDAVNDCGMVYYTIPLEVVCCFQVFHIFYFLYFSNLYFLLSNLSYFSFSFHLYSLIWPLFSL